MVDPFRRLHSVCQVFLYKLYMWILNFGRSHRTQMLLKRVIAVLLVGYIIKVGDRSVDVNHMTVTEIPLAQSLCYKFKAANERRKSIMCYSIFTTDARQVYHCNYSIVILFIVYQYSLMIIAALLYLHIKQVKFILCCCLASNRSLKTSLKPQTHQLFQQFER